MIREIRIYRILSNCSQRLRECFGARSLKKRAGRSENLPPFTIRWGGQQDVALLQRESRKDNTNRRAFGAV
jgi:hypothetical protein